MPLVLLLFFLLLPAPLRAETDMFSFAQSLAESGDHYRAITEFKRFLHYHPDDPRAPQALLAIAKSLHAGRRWQDLDPALAEVWQLYPDSPEAGAAHRLYAQAAAERKDFVEARRRYRQLTAENRIDPQLADYLIGLTYLEEDRLAEAQESFAPLDPGRYPDLQPALHDFQLLPHKSPQLAGTLSALLPGAGQLYTERPRQAAITFALNAAFVYGAAEAWNNKDYVVAGLVSLFEIGWYGGNIYNAVNNAHRYNHRQQQRLLDRLKQYVDLSLNFRDHSPWLQAQVRF